MRAVVHQNGFDMNVVLGLHSAGDIGERGKEERQALLLVKTGNNNGDKAHSVMNPPVETTFNSESLAL